MDRIVCMPIDMSAVDMRVADMPIYLYIYSLTPESVFIGRTKAATSEEVTTDPQKQTTTRCRSQPVLCC